MQWHILLNGGKRHCWASVWMTVWGDPTKGSTVGCVAFIKLRSIWWSPEWYSRAASRSFDAAAAVAAAERNDYGLCCTLGRVAGGVNGFCAAKRNTAPTKRLSSHRHITRYIAAYKIHCFAPNRIKTSRVYWFLSHIITDWVYNFNYFCAKKDNL